MSCTARTTPKLSSWSCTCANSVDVHQHVISIGGVLVGMANSEVGIVPAAERGSSQTQCLGRLSSSIVRNMTFLLSGRF